MVELVRGRYRVILTDETNEGRDGDYNPKDPNDYVHLRYYVDVESDDPHLLGWDGVENASYCTSLRADAPERVKHAALRKIADSGISAIVIDKNLGDLFELATRNVILAKGEEERAQQSYARKIKEVILALEVTRRYSKEKVLEWYLNYNFYGNLAYGVEAASQVYFGKSSEELGIAEAAMLAAIPQFPALNPIDAPEEKPYEVTEIDDKLAPYE